MNKLVNAIRAFLDTSSKLHGPNGIRAMGHRDYVGGLWGEMGQLQFNFLVSQGLKPTDYLLDIACGSLRAGVHLIPYLEMGHYLGIEKEPELLEAGIKYELGQALYLEKQPQLVASASFEFEKFSVSPTYALAQSLFTHLPQSAIHLCFQKLRAKMDKSGLFFASYFQVDSPRKNPIEPHDHLSFAYTRKEMEAFGTQNGWHCTYIGDWGHPRGQVMVKYCIY